LKIPPGYEAHQRGSLTTLTHGKRSDMIPTDDAEETAWRRWVKRARSVPDPVPPGAPRWLCRLFAESMGDATGHGQRHAARHLGISDRAMRYYCADARTMPHALAVSLLAAIRSTKKQRRSTK
jgi:hypothetical protein